jgi:hypothetical protein
VKIATRVIVACLSFSPAPALAWDWSLSSTLSETLELNDNQYMRTMLAGGTLGSYSTVTANALARTPTSRILLDGDVSYRKYWGPGTEGTQTESVGGGVHAHYETWGKDNTDRNYLDVNWRRQNTQLAVLGELGFATTAHGDIDRTTVRGGIERSISALDFVSFSAGSTLTTYDPHSGGTAFTDSSANATWRRRLNPTTSLTASSEFEWLNFDSTPAATLMLLRNTAGVDMTLSPLWSFRASAGVVYVNADQSAATVSPLGPSLPGTALSSSGSATDFIADMFLSYKMLKNTTLTLSGGQTVAPSIIGTLVKLTSARAGVTRQINDWSTISFAADASRQIASGTTSEFFSGSASYGYVIARDWNASLTYRYLHRLASTGGTLLFDPVTGLPISGTGPASSNSLMMVVTKNTTIIPLGN